MESADQQSSKGASYLGQVQVKASKLKTTVSEQMRDFKSTSAIIERLSMLADVLKGAENSTLKNESFFSNLTEVSTTLDLIGA